MKPKPKQRKKIKPLIMWAVVDRDDYRSIWEVAHTRRDVIDAFCFNCMEDRTFWESRKSSYKAIKVEIKPC